jgi:hypothetical protein
MSLPASLRPDCARCAALCCVAPAFDAGQGFGYDKPAREPCRNLMADNRCAIHPALVAQGFGGCASFDCFGAGQRATALFAGADWRLTPDRAPDMFEAYARLRALHELQAMATLALPRARDEAAGSVRQLLARLASMCETNEAIDAVALRRAALATIRDAMNGVKPE